MGSSGLGKTRGTNRLETMKMSKKSDKFSQDDITYLANGGKSQRVIDCTLRHLNKLVEDRDALLTALKGSLPYLKTLHSEDAYGSCPNGIEDCCCDLSDDYANAMKIIKQAEKED